MRTAVKRVLALFLSMLLVLSVVHSTAEGSGNAADLYELGNDAYRQSNYQAAADYFRKAADLGLDVAQASLGVLHYYGLGVEQSYEKAMEYWQMAADQGYAIAMTNLGTLYAFGTGVKQSYEKAVEYFIAAADLGDLNAVNWIGSFYESGQGVEQSYEKALEYYRILVEHGDPAGLIHLGMFYCLGTGVEQSYEKAMEYWQMAADQNDVMELKAIALNNIGSLYMRGEGVEQSYETAAEYYRAASELGHVMAQDRLGSLYEQGNGVEQSYEKAAEYYQLSADQAEYEEYPDGLYHLGRLYQEGLGVEQSVEKATELYVRAVLLGSEEARTEIEKIAAANSYGLTPTEGIIIPDYAEDKMNTFDIPDTEAMSFIRKLAPGWNLGNTFDAKDAGPGNPAIDYETYWSGAKTSQALFHAIRQAGFSLVRIPVSWHNHLTDDAFTIDPAWMERVKEVAGWALDKGLYVIINIHHDDEKGYLYPDTDHETQSEQYISAVWRQISEAFAEYDEHVLFESMNEPRLTGTEYEWNPNPGIPEVLDAMQCINQLNRVFVETVRASGGKNASRYLVVPGYCGSFGGALADAFELPADDRIIVEVHAYTPYHYALDPTDPDSSFDPETDTDKTGEITGFMDDLYRKFITRGIPVIIDEFGALKKTEEDLQGRVRYAAFYTAAAGARGIPCVWWDNANFTGEGEKFGLFDRNRLEWVYPDIVLSILRNCAYDDADGND